MNGATTPPDRALWGILITNVVTLLWALWQQWSVLQLLWPFWMQSLIIGWYARQRMLKVTTFCTQGMLVNGRPVKPTPAVARQAANFFLLHYGGFHFGYLIFLMALTFTTDAAGYILVTNESTGVQSEVHIGHIHPLDSLAFIALAYGFWRSHRASHLEHVAADLGRTPKLGTLMMMPYARVIPMHFAIILAVAFGTAAIGLFVLLKTVADVVMHRVEHRVLGGRNEPPPYQYMN
ncbi:MAG: hypothetical protein JJU22_05125 [Gammaproteobacteria bacterium]|nr:hypothetical protein [Gammaproteobacteria bacterium]